MNLSRDLSCHDLNFSLDDKKLTLGKHGDKLKHYQGPYQEISFPARITTSFGYCLYIYYLYKYSDLEWLIVTEGGGTRIFTNMDGYHQGYVYNECGQCIAVHRNDEFQTLKKSLQNYNPVLVKMQQVKNGSCILKTH